MDAETLTFLLRGGHLNMEERNEKGLWPHPPLSYTDVCDHLIHVIENEEWFPCDLSQGREGVVIHNKGGTYICHSLQYSAFGAPIISDKQEQSFDTPREAVDFYLKWDMHLPGDMDGWKVT